MKIRLKLFATLADYLPPGQRGHEIDVEIAANDPIERVLERFQVPLRLVHLVLVNGNYIAPAERRTYCLAEGDHLAVWPPIAGG